MISPYFCATKFLYMYNGLLHLHNLMRWVIILLLVIAIFNAISGMLNKRQYTGFDRKTALFLMIASHITLLVGIYQWVVGPWGLKNIQNLGMAAVMKDPVARFFAIEHMVSMLIAIVLITIGRGVGKKNISPERKHKKSFWMFLLALILILVAIPWPFREVARPLFPGM